MLKQVSIHMPNGKPAPYLMTAEELGEFLRIKETGGNDVVRAIQRLRDSGKLKPTQISKGYVYSLPDVLRCIDEKGL